MSHQLRAEHSRPIGQALRQLVGEAEDAGLELPAMIETLEEQATAMREAWE